MLEGDDFGIDVRTDEALATQIGITSVPTFVLDQKYGVTGAQPVDAMLQAIRQVWDLQGTEPEMPAAGGGCGGGCCGGACGSDGAEEPTAEAAGTEAGCGCGAGGCGGVCGPESADEPVDLRRAERGPPGREDTPRTWKSPPALAAFLPWGSSAGYHHAGCRARWYGWSARRGKFGPPDRPTGRDRSRPV